MCRRCHPQIFARYDGEVGFKDHFSKQAADYRRFRPRYPAALCSWLAAEAPARTLALDVATGNGQAALELAAHFTRVLASDASAQQLAQAERHPRVTYLRHAAERLPVRSGAAELVAVAQAAHWFDLAPFYAEARRVLRPGGLIALWTYATLSVDAAIDPLIEHFYSGVVGRYWPPERRLVETGYRTLPFPFAELTPPACALEASWTPEQLLSYLGTWSAVQRYRSVVGSDPLPALGAELAAAWPDGAPRPVRFPLHLRIGRV